jgi:hypothetical protein
MKNLIFVILFFSCGVINLPKKENMQRRLFLAASVIAVNFGDECLSSYSYLSPLYNPYLNVIPSYNGGKSVIIGDSTMELSKAENVWESTTDNRAISGNTACDFLFQIRGVGNGYETLIIASMDGNGIIRGVSSANSIATLTKVASYGIEILKVKNVILIGNHPVKNPDINFKKNIINDAMNSMATSKGYCFIDTVSLWGSSPTSTATDSMMKVEIDGSIDNIHYNQKYYPVLKKKILSQCGLTI